MKLFEVCCSNVRMKTVDGKYCTMLTVEREDNRIAFNRHECKWHLKRPQKFLIVVQ